MGWKGSKLVHKFGNVAAGNYTELLSDGTMRMIGNATVWADMIGDLFGRRLSSTTGKVDYDYDENHIKFQSGGSITTRNDRIGANLEINHQFKIGSNITFKPHIHWFQTISGGAIEHAYVLTMRYRLQRNGYAKATAWTTVTLTAGTDDIFDFTSEADGEYCQISTFPAATITCGLSDTIQFQMARTDSLGDTMKVYFMDVHGEIDSEGSDTEWSKS